jgi:hypothetical protein
MAIFISGMICPICSQPIEGTDEFVAFPPFVENEIDPLWIFSDSVLHQKCFDEHPLSTQALLRYEVTRKLRVRPKTCVVCKMDVTTPDDYFVLGHLTDDINDPLFEYNYTQFHLSHLSQWADLDLICALITEARRSGKMKGKGVDWMLSRLQAK